jgi:hypothetical protein
MFTYYQIFQIQATWPPLLSNPFIRETNPETPICKVVAAVMMALVKKL